MNIKEILKKSIIILQNYKIKFPHLEAEILLSFVLKKPREFILTHSEYELTTAQRTQYSKLINQKCQEKPTAYLTGGKEFYGLQFLVNKNVLIPRPETELMVECALAVLENNINNRNLIVDIGTGSGCIIITIADFCSGKNKKYQNDYVAIDISKTALKVARQNASLHNLKEVIKFLKGDLLSSFKNQKKYDNILFLANLPYLTKEQIKRSDSIKYEPKIALIAGQDGLKYYKKLFKQINKITKANFILLAEIDPSQRKKITTEAKKCLPTTKITIKIDLKGHHRLLSIVNQG